jgi:two-component system chemotaxis response regulator CheY
VSNQRARILVVDDDLDIAELVRLALTDEGFDVITATNGAAALDVAQATPPDLVLLDMRMPIMDGWTFARRYRSAPPPRAPIVVMTAARDAAERAAEIDADGYLSKPFSLDELFGIVDQHIGDD